MKKRVLVLSGFDPSGGAGLLMDIKVLTLLGFKACGIPTALTFQNTRIFENWVPIESSAFEWMLRLTLEDELPLGVKIGMLATPEIVKISADYLKRHRREIKWVALDPVLKATLKKELFRGEEFVEVLKGELFPVVDVITPNVKEAEILTEVKINSSEDIKKALLVFKDLGVSFPVITGFEEKGRRVSFFLEEGERAGRVSVKSLSSEFHGTGCALSSALLAFLLKKGNPPLALRMATKWLYRRLLLPEGEENFYKDFRGLKIFL